MISEKTLRKWSADALKPANPIDSSEYFIELHFHNIEMKERILRLTQELLDQHLLRKS